MRAAGTLGGLLAGLLVTSAAHALGAPSGGSASAATVVAPTTPASVRGLADDATIDVFTGQASYAVPFDLPAGPGGVRPALSLRYEGSLGNGPFGVGFTLSIPEVRRSTRLGVPSYAATDELELVGVKGGGRLVEAGDGTLRLEGHGNEVKVIRAGGAIVVQDGDGVEYLMGFTPQSRVVSGARVFAWKVQQIRHPSGQTVNFVYARNQGNLELDTVRWGPQGRYGVDVVYAVRPDRVTSYRSGFPVEQARRVSRFDVLSGGQALRRYAFTYDDALPLSRLVRVEQQGLLGQGALPPVTFGYGAAQPARVTAMSGTGAWSLTDPDTTLFDVDGDGVADLVRMTGAQHTYRRNVGGAFLAPAPIPSDAAGAPPSLAASRLMGMEGKGRPDLVRVVGGQWVVQRLEGGRWVTAGTWQNTANVALAGPSVDFADVNGDGRTDRIEAVASGLLVRMNGDRAIGTTAQGASPAGNVVPGGVGVDFQDMNGDGLADAVVMGLASAQVYAGLGDGTFVTTPVRVTYPPALVTNDRSEVRLGDLDSDGVADFVRVSAASVVWFPMRPDGTFMTDPAGAVVTRAVPRPQGVAFDAVVAIADANGNGSQDVVWSSPQGLWVLDLAGTTTAAMLTRVDNGMGQTMTFGYEASALLALQAELDPAVPDWSERLPVSIPVPTEVRVSLASGGPARVSRIAVRDGVWDGAERRFGGFLVGTRRAEGTTPDRTLVETTTFHPGRGADRALRGKPLRVERRDGAGTLFTVEESGWTPLAVSGLPAGVPLLRLPARTFARTSHHEGTALPAVVETTFAHDTDGNVAREVRRGLTSSAADDFSVERTFAWNDTTWVRGRLVGETTRDAGGRAVRQTRRTYDGTPAAPLALGRVERGWLRRVEAYYTEGARWIPQETTDHDTWGNAVATYRGGVSRTVTYDPDGVHAVHEEVRPSGTTTLAWNVTAWDPVLDKPLAMTDPNGVTRAFTYDTLGRLTSIAVDGAPAHVSYAYGWTAPRPTVTTTERDGAAGVRTRVDVMDSHGDPLYRATAYAGGYLVDGFVSRDARGDVAETAEPFQTGAALPASIPAGTPRTTHALDALGRPRVTVRPGGARVTVARGPLRETTTEDGLAPVARATDGQGRIVSVDRLLASGVERSVFTYDPFGHVTSAELGGGRVVSRHAYDSLGRLVASTDPERGRRTYGYDDADRLLVTTSAASEWVRNTYDAIGRVTERRGSDGTLYTFVYDAPAASRQRTLGRLAYVDEPTGRVELSYDAFGRVVRRARTVSGRTGVEVTTYSPAGLLLGKSWDDGLSLAYAYDAAARPSRVTSTAGAVAVREWERLAVDAAGRVLGERSGNGVEATYALDAAGLPARIQVTGSGGALMDLAVSRRTPYGAPITVTDQDGVGRDHSAAMAYDDAARLTSARTAGLTFGYGYDNLQNMVSRTVVGAAPAGMLSGAYVHDPLRPRLLVRAGTAALAYDAAGRAVTADGATLSYDPFDHLRQVRPPGAPAVVTHDYGYDGERVRTVAPDGTVERRYGEDDLETGPGARQHYVRIAGRLLARIDRSGALTSGATYYHRGLDAGPALLTGARGVVTDERVFEPYGSPIAASMKRDPHGAGNKPVDPSTGFADHGARWLMASAGRWQAPDPASDTPGPAYVERPWKLAPYTYAANNPLFYWDPDGRDEESYEARAYAESREHGRQIMERARYMNRTHAYRTMDRDLWLGGLALLARTAGVEGLIKGFETGLEVGAERVGAHGLGRAAPYVGVGLSVAVGLYELVEMHEKAKEWQEHVEAFNREWEAKERAAQAAAEGQKSEAERKASAGAPRVTVAEFDRGTTIVVPRSAPPVTRAPTAAAVAEHAHEPFTRTGVCGPPK